jgi:hypothetical protein
VPSEHDLQSRVLVNLVNVDTLVNLSKRVYEDTVLAMTDYRLAAAKNYLTTALPSDFRQLLADVVGLADDCMDTELDQRVTQALDDGGLYLCPSDVLSLCPECLGRAIESVTTDLSSSET